MHNVCAFVWLYLRCLLRCVDVVEQALKTFGLIDLHFCLQIRAKSHHVDACMCTVLLCSYVFWLGDLNFRMNKLSASEVKSRIAAGNLQSLWAYDQVIAYSHVTVSAPRPVISIISAECHLCLTSIGLHCLVAEADRCVNNLAAVTA